MARGAAPQGGQGGPRGPRRPGSQRAPRSTQRLRTLSGDTGSTTAVGTGTAGRRRPRLTGRALILLLVLAVLTVSYASSLKAYLQQRSQIDTLKAQIAEREASITDLEREKERWQDPAYVSAKARERLSYVMPGETSYVVLGEDGKPIQTQATLHDPKQLFQKAPKAWWTDVWSSVELAGDPPKTEPPPATLLKK